MHWTEPTEWRRVKGNAREIARNYHCLPQLGNTGAYLYQKMSDKLVEHKQYIHDFGVDLPEVVNWKWEDIN